jgi:hypothetical protein
LIGGLLPARFPQNRLAIICSFLNEVLFVILDIGNPRTELQNDVVEGGDLGVCIRHNGAA